MFDKDDIPPRFEDHADRAAYLFAEYKYGVYIAVAAGTILVASGRVGLPTIPPVVGWFLKWSVVGILPAMWAGKVLIVDRWIPDPRYRVLEIDTENKMSLKPHMVPKSLWRQRKRGEHSALKPDEGFFDYVVTEYQHDEELGTLTIEGANQELVDPVGMVATQNKIDTIYGELLGKAADLERIEASERMRRFQVEEQVVNSLIGAVEHGLEFEPGTTEEIVRDLDETEVGASDKDRGARTDEIEERPTLSDMLDDEGGIGGQLVGSQTATDGGENR